VRDELKVVRSDQIKEFIFNRLQTTGVEIRITVAICCYAVNLAFFRQEAGRIGNCATITTKEAAIVDLNMNTAFDQLLYHSGCFGQVFTPFWMGQ
jgi:hypothetical protein